MYFHYCTISVPQVNATHYGNRFSEKENTSERDCAILSIRLGQSSTRDMKAK